MLSEITRDLVLAKALKRAPSKKTQTFLNSVNDISLKEYLTNREDYKRSLAKFEREDTLALISKLNDGKLENLSVDSSFYTSIVRGDYVRVIHQDRLFPRVRNTFFNSPEGSFKVSSSTDLSSIEITYRSKIVTDLEINEDITFLGVVLSNSYFLINNLVPRSFLLVFPEAVKISSLSEKFTLPRISKLLISLKLYIPRVESLERYFLNGYKDLTKLDIKAPSLRGIEDLSFCDLESIEELKLYLPRLRSLGPECFCGSLGLKSIKLYLPQNNSILKFNGERGIKVVEYIVKGKPINNRYRQSDNYTQTLLENDFMFMDEGYEFQSRGRVLSDEETLRYYVMSDEELNFKKISEYYDYGSSDESDYILEDD
jgi:hypothetical protein